MLACEIFLKILLYCVGSVVGKWLFDDDYWLLDRGRNTTCKVFNVGANIVSWKVEGVEQLFLSKNAIFSAVDPILGGMPIVFPIYGEWPLCLHDGFLRHLRWDFVTRPKLLENGDVFMSLFRRDTDYSRNFYPFEWRISYEITLGEKSLTTRIHIWNPEPTLGIRFKLAFHNYIQVPEITKCRIKGLRNATYYDNTIPEMFPPPVSTPMYQEFRDTRISNWTERHYIAAGNEILITNVQGGKSLKITKTGFPDIVVWHSWNDNYKPKERLADGEYLRYISVQPAIVEDFFRLNANETWEGTQTLEVVDADYDFEY